MRTIKLLGISGSLRKDSYNTKLLNVTKKLLPEGVTMEIFSIADIPFYNADLDKPLADKRPDAVERLRQAIKNADGLVIASPEYNYGLPGVLKNMIDWASRGNDSPLMKKPIAIMGATVTAGGTGRMQLAFTGIYLAMNMLPVYTPEVLIAQCNQKFYEDGSLSDEKAKELIIQKMNALVQLIKGK